MTGTRLFVGNIPYSMTDKEIGELFAGCGAVASVRIITDFDTGRSKGYAFVEMASPDEAEKAIQKLNGTSLGGRSIVVNEARPRAGGGKPRRGPRGED